MAIDLTNGYADLKAHVGHELECVSYADDENIALECVACGMVLIDFDKPLSVLEQERETRTLTVREARAIVRQLGLVLRRDRETGEYMVNFAHGHEWTRYFTNDLNDAVGTARMMARRRDGQ